MTAHQAASLKAAQRKKDSAWAAHSAAPSLLNRAAMTSASHSLAAVQSAVWNGTEWQNRSHKPL